jgi:hypothetical protein
MPLGDKLPSSGMKIIPSKEDDRENEVKKCRAEGCAAGTSPHGNEKGGNQRKNDQQEKWAHERVLFNGQ